MRPPAGVGGSAGPWSFPAPTRCKFEHGRSIGTNLISWPKEHVAKCLVFYHPDDPAEAHRLEQEAQVRALFEATRVPAVMNCYWKSSRPRIAPKPTPSTALSKRVLRPGHQTGMVGSWSP